MIDKEMQSLLEKHGSNFEYLKAYILPENDIYGGNVRKMTAMFCFLKLHFHINVACVTVEVSSLHGFQSRYQTM